MPEPEDLSLPFPAGNLFADVPATLPEEVFQEILTRKILSSGDGAIRLERILSNGQSSPPGFWYDQDEDEWVLLLKGSAAIEFQDGESHALEPGSYLFIPRHQRHRVARTGPGTVWLAVFFNSDIP